MGKLFCWHLALTCAKLESLRHVSKHYEMHFAHTMQIASTLKQKAQTTYEHALTNTSILWGNWTLKIDLSNICDLQNQAKLAYIYNFENTCKSKAL
jgi:hypothetical protein